MQRRVPIAVSGVQLGTFRDEQYDHGEVSEATSEVERRVPDSACHVQPFFFAKRWIDTRDINIDKV